MIAPGFLSTMLSEPVAAALLSAAAVLQVFGFVVIRRLGRVG
jgi:Flp pilus assembly protein TadB